MSATEAYLAPVNKEYLLIKDRRSIKLGQVIEMEYSIFAALPKALKS